MSQNSLLASKTPGIIISEIVMMSSTFKGINFLVEGEDDSKFWKTRLHPTNVSIVCCEGKQNLLGAAALALQQNLRVVGMYDADFDRHSNTVHMPQILAVSDENDLETTLLSSQAAAAFLHEYGDEQLIQSFSQQGNLTPVEYVQQVSAKFGALRYLNQHRQHGVNFDDLSPYRFVCPHQWVLDEVSLHAEYARLAGITDVQLQNELNGFCPAPQGWSMSQGHDCIRILAQGIKNRIGRQQMNEKDVMRVLRIAYSEKMLLSSRMYTSLKTLEGSIADNLF